MVTVGIVVVVVVGGDVIVLLMMLLGVILLLLSVVLGSVVVDGSGVVFAVIVGTIGGGDGCFCFVAFVIVFCNYHCYYHDCSCC